MLMSMRLLYAMRVGMRNGHTYSLYILHMCAWGFVHTISSFVNQTTWFSSPHLLTQVSLRAGQRSARAPRARLRLIWHSASPRLRG
jgi:hypothetical protein